MKTLLILSFVLSLGAFAQAAEKTCTGTNLGQEDATGDSFTFTATKEKIAVSGGASFIADGSYDMERTVDGKDGKTYIAYDLGEDDGDNFVQVDEALLTEGGKGLAKVENRGEGYMLYIYDCK